MLWDTGYQELELQERSEKLAVSLCASPAGEAFAFALGQVFTDCSFALKLLHFTIKMPDYWG